MRTNICQQCNRPFQLSPKARREQKYCSHTCYAQSMVSRVIKTCEQCSKPFEVLQGRRGDRRFCSRACLTKFNTHRVTRICEQCGQSFEVIQSQKGRRFCSTTCTGQYNTTRIKKVCKTCGKTFEVIPARSDASFCSFECQMIEQRKKVELTCVYCGKNFYEKLSHAHYRRTCSRSCQAKLRAQEGRSPLQGRTRPDEERQMLSEKVHQYYQANPEKHPWYVDGAYANGELKRGPSWQQQRKAARKRDNYMCRRCGKTETQLGKQLSVHHKKPYRLFASSDEANALDNLICLCQSCHWKVEHNPALLDEIA